MGERAGRAQAATITPITRTGSDRPGGLGDAGRPAGLGDAGPPVAAGPQVAAGPPRIAPIDEAEASDVQRDLLAPVVGGPGPRATNLYMTLIRHPKVFHRVEAFGGTLLFRGLLSPRHREILILRTAHNTGSDYEWGQHVRVGSAVGLGPEQIARCARDGGWTAEEALLITVADELHATSTISDQTWARLSERYDEAQLIEIVTVVGYYHQMAFLLNALGIRREEGVAGFPPGHGPRSGSPSGTG
jgi:alkylhydroperoxidase family enzyme